MICLEPIKAFLKCSTPNAWIQQALIQQDILLIDHAHCEKKAASNAMNMLYRYPEKSQLLEKMAQLAREELLHFEQVLALINSRGIEYKYLAPPNYVASMRKYARKKEPGKLIDHLIIGAIIEARSCERFAAVAPYLDKELQHFYLHLLRSESRHFQDYLMLAKLYSDVPINDRVDLFLDVETDLITKVDNEFRFHSGVPN